MNEVYLGDGLFASFDGFQFKLRTPREFGDHEVYLEPSVLQNFLDFVGKAHKVHLNTRIDVEKK